MKARSWILLGTITALAPSLLSCSTSAPRPDEIPSLRSDRMESVAILGLNDFHGALQPTGDEGGASLLAAHVAIQRRVYRDRLLLIDAGNQWDGSLESTLTLARPVVELYNGLGMGSSAAGFHEFSLGEDAFRNRLQEARYPYVVSNLRPKKGAFPATLKTRSLVHVGRLKVGHINVISAQISKLIRPELVGEWEILDPAPAIHEEAGRLRQEGAQIVILTANLQQSCRAPASRPDDDERAPSETRVVSAQNAPAGCDSQDELSRLLRRIHPGTIDAVITSGTHQIIQDWVGGVPVVQSGSHGRHYQLIHFTYDLEAGKLLPDLTRIEGAFHVSRKTRLYGIAVNEHRPTEEKFRHLVNQVAEVRARAVGEAIGKLRHDYRFESQLGNLVADAIRAGSGSDVAIVHPGLIQIDSLDEGKITWGAIYEMLPFESRVSRLHLTGSELKTLVRIANNGARGFYGISGLQASVIDLESPAESRDLDGNRHISHWEVNRLPRIRLEGGQRIQDNRIYTLAAPDYLARGGDDLAWMISRIPADRIELDSGSSVRDSVLNYLEQNSPVNSAQSPLVDPSRPRLKFQGRGRL